MTIRFYKFLIVLGTLFFGLKGLARNSCDSLPAISISGKSMMASPVEKRPMTLGDFSSSLPPDNYVRNLSFFCRQEVKFEKAVGIPLRFRVGSLEQCNRIEGK